MILHDTHDTNDITANTVHRALYEQALEQIAELEQQKNSALYETKRLRKILGRLVDLCWPSLEEARAVLAAPKEIKPCATCGGSQAIHPSLPGPPVHCPDCVKWDDNAKR